MEHELSSRRAGSAGDEEERTLLELVVFVPVGIAALAREAVEKLISEGAARGELEVSRLRNALENEVGIARSVGRARVRGVISRTAERFEYPPLSIVAGVARAVAERSRQVLDELYASAEDRASTERSASGVEGGSGAEPAGGESRGLGLASLRSAQRTAAARVLKARFGGDERGAGNGEVVRVVFEEGSQTQQPSADQDSVATPGDARGSDSILKSESNEGTDRQPDEVDRPDGDTVGPEPPSSLQDYDSLSATQIVARLGGLSEDELKALLQYESATRSRAAVLERARRELEARQET